MTRVTLSRSELDECEQIALLLESNSCGLKDRFETSKPASVHYRKGSCCGELAASLVYQLEWNARTRINNFGGPDLGNNTAVRTRGKDHYSLCIYPHEQGNYIFVFVTGAWPIAHYNVWGHIRGDRGRQIGWYGIMKGCVYPGHWIAKEHLIVAPELQGL